MTGTHKACNAECECSLKPDDTARALGQRFGFLFFTVRSVVRCNDGDDIFLESADDLLTVGRGAQVAGSFWRGSRV